MQSLKIRATSLEVDGASFEAPFAAAFVSAFGPHDRYSDGLLSPPPGGKLNRNHFIRAHMCDNVGFVYYTRHPELTLSHCYFSFVIEDTPAQPHSPFSGSIEINGLRLHSEVTEGDVPLHGETPMTKDRFSLFYRGPAFRVDLGFARSRNKLGKRIGKKRLTYLAISFGRLEQTDRREIPRVEVHRNDAIEVQFQYDGTKHYIWLNSPSTDEVRPLHIDAEQVAPNSERAKELLTNIDLWWDELPNDLRVRVTEIAARSGPLSHPDDLTKEAIHLSPVLRLRDYLRTHYVGLGS